MRIGVGAPGNGSEGILAVVEDVVEGANEGPHIVFMALAELVEDAVHVLVDILQLKLHVIVVLEVDFLIQSLHFASGIVVVVADYVGVLLEVYLRMDEVVEALLVE